MDLPRYVHAHAYPVGTLILFKHSLDVSFKFLNYQGERQEH